MRQTARYFDISKSFDREWHRGLLYKLEKYGIKEELLLWIESYLRVIISKHQKIAIMAENDMS